ncbi:MAG: DHA2 family efflux MFS transporter permease subunit [Gemmatimonadaceae bacterium]|nr:DHA2 family efflux MFS transporter permease subunit [Gemmatimonadaceae bacterium]
MTARPAPEAVDVPKRATVPADATEGDPHKWLIAIAVMLASMMQVIDTSIVNVAIPHMMGELGASIDEIAWVSTGYILASVIVMPMTGWLAAYFGRKRYFAASIVIFTAASFFCGASDTLGTLIVWRIVQGIGGGALITTSQALLYEVFPRKEIGTALAVFGLGVMVGPTLGPTLGGWLTDAWSWPWIFFINIPIGIVAAVMVLVYVHDAPHHIKPRTIDYLGVAMLAASVGAMQYVLEHGQGDDWFDSRTIVVLSIVAVVSAVALVWRELTVDEPIIDFRVLRHRGMWIGTVIGILFGVGLFGSVFVLPIFLQGMLRMSAWQTGMVILPGSIATAVSMTIVGRQMNRLDARWVIATGIVVFGWSMWDLSRITAQAGAADFLWPLILRGLGLGMMFVPLTNIALADLGPSELPQGAALSNFFRQLGGSFGIAAMASLLTRYTQQARAVLLEHVAVTDPVSLERVGTLARGFVARGADTWTAQRLALATVDRQVLAQANAIAFGKVYLFSGLIMLASLPLVLLVRRPTPSRGGPPVHAE